MTEISSPEANTTLPGHACQVLSAEAVYVCHGVNLGEALSGPEDVYAGDYYQLDPDQAPLRLVLNRPVDGVQSVAAGSEVGLLGQSVRFEARYGMMSADGDRVELLLIALEGGGHFVLPLSPMSASKDYNLVSIEEDPETTALSDLLCVSFARGTMITLASGQQRAIEDLEPGTKVLTRDHGAQGIRWIGNTTLRAVGAFAPVVITAGTLGNGGDLIVSQHHRMFLYQRQRRAGLPTSELLVQAKHLIDGERVYLREGGFVDYFSLVFERHEIIYAEGVPAESLMVNDATVNMLPQELSEDVKARFPGLSQNQHFGTEAGRQFLEQLGAETLYRPSARPLR